MATDLGKVGMVMKGTWSNNATYEVLDAVTYNNGLYIAKQEVPAGTLPTNTSYWQVGIDASAIMPTRDSFSVSANSYINLGVSSADYIVGGGSVYMLFHSSNVSDLNGIFRTNSQKVVAYSDLLTASGLSAAIDGNFLKITNSTAYTFTVYIYRMI